MPCYYDESKKTWYCKFYYKDYTGARKQKMKRGFALQREAKEWEREFLGKHALEPDILFFTAVDAYLEDMRARTKDVTYQGKKGIIHRHILPYFGRMRINEITPAQVRQWQLDLKNVIGKRGRPLSSGYLNLMMIELSSIFNYAIKFYKLSSNPCRIAGNIAVKSHKSLNFWTKAEFDQFIASFEPSDPYRVAYMTLYYTGLRIGELTALTAADIDLEKLTISVTKTHHVANRKDVITPPKTKKSNRVITIPEKLGETLAAHMKRFYGLTSDTRLFTSTHCAYWQQIAAHARAAGVKVIRTHDLRHSHASLLIDMGFTPLLVSERLGHESVSTTLNVYAHLFPSRQQELAEKLNELMILI